THAALVEAAARAGKHVFCEKPLDLDPVRIRTWLEAVARAGVRLQLGFNRRFDAQFQRVAALVRDGSLGSPQLLRITSRDPAPPPREYLARSGGLFLDMAIHDFDMARFLTGDEDGEVSAAGAALVDPAARELGDWDTAVTTLRFRGGALAAVDNSRQAVYGYDQRVEVFGSKGCALAPNVAPNAVSRWTADGSSRDPAHRFFIDRYREAYLAELTEFARCAREDREPPVNGDDGLQAVLIALAAKRSAALGRPVKVSEAECAIGR
ncbi:MAG: Gfo/Idh/MocA family oxidoreductase, partial [Elusimicrobia bacterium]|nr:Gfo/Idh/MocA family oxidoreductase [Elusimicrobiota bacterium]